MDIKETFLKHGTIFNEEGILRLVFASIVQDLLEVPVQKQTDIIHEWASQWGCV
jgi:hypothetical protein